MAGNLAVPVLPGSSLVDTVVDFVADTLLAASMTDGSPRVLCLPQGRCSPYGPRRIAVGPARRSNLNLDSAAMRVLIAEDDASVREALASVLHKSGHLVAQTALGAEVLANHETADLLLLDLGLADGDGLDVLRDLRKVSRLPVIIVTARGDERTTVRGLMLGADDYLVKPVRRHELLARIAAVARRHREAVHRSDIVTAGEVEIDLAARRATHYGSLLPLTSKEFAVLAILARDLGAAVPRARLVEEVWGETYNASSRAFDVHVAQLRQKLPDPAMITTIRGYGYRLEL